MSGKRKFMVFLVLVVTLLLSNLASAADPVAIIVDFEKVEDGLSIERASSDSYPRKYDLYWLSGQLARQVRDKNLMGRKNLILTKCQQHLMPAYK